jgi:error-prone DNA polymerase
LSSVQLASSSYVELKCKSNFSFLTGASHPEELTRTAIGIGLRGLAITDINGLYGMPRSYKESKAYPDFKLVCGAELSFSDHSPVTFLAKTKAAYALLCRLVTLSKSDKKKGEGSLEFRQFLDFALEHIGHRELIFLLNEDANFLDFKNYFDGQIYLPLTMYLDGRDQSRVKKAFELNFKFGVPLIASNDVQYHQKTRKLVQDVLISIRENKPLSEIGFKIAPNAERYLKTPAEMRHLYKDWPELLTRTIDIAEMCEFSPSELKYRYPSEWIPREFTAQSYLEHLVWRSAPGRYQSGVTDQVRAQVLHELKLIEELGYADYFLTIYDIVGFAQRNNILCQGRGSAANSVICFILGITAIDPIQMNLLFERFISAERGEPPDIDIDFEHERREEVIQYIYQKYGRDRAAMVSAVVTYRYRSAFREVCKAFGIEVGTLSARKVEKSFDELAQKHEDPKKLREQIDYFASELQGFPRHLSIHSGGFTLSADPIIDLVPVEAARMSGRSIIQWDKYDLDTLGLIKVDVLSLGMLSCLRKCLALVNRKLYEIPHDDAKTYEMISRGDTVGVFQIESRAQMNMLGRLQPKNFYDLVIEVAIVRPGPIVGNMIHPYLKRRRGLEKISFPNEKVRKILGKTLGIPLFQEQVMKLAIDLAGFSPGEADQLRKCINAWRSSAPIGVMAQRLKRGMMKSGISEEYADQIFDQIQGFSHYGFPESHAASFALLVYASCYLKAHHPAEFAVSLINSQPMGFYRTDTIVYDALRHDVKVLPVSVMSSGWDCHIESPNVIRLGFRIATGIAESDVRDFICEREAMGFKSLSDFMKRSRIRKDVLGRIALAGRFDELNWEPRESLWAILEYQNLIGVECGQQMNFFKDTHYLDEMSGEQEAKPPVFEEMQAFEKIQNDYNAFSLSTHGHPMQEMRKKFARIPKMNSQLIRQTPSLKKISVSGLVLIRQKPPTAKGVCFATMEDEFGFIDLVLWRNIFEEYKDVFLYHCFITITGVVQRDMNTISVLVNRVCPIWTVQDEMPLSIEPQQYFY